MSAVIEFSGVRNRNPHSLPSALEMGDLANRAPSVVATQPASTVSDRYRFIPTTQVITDLDRAGWKPFAVQQTNSRKTDGAATAKHLLRFFNPELYTPDGREFVTLNLINSHNAGSSFRFLLGVYRLICANGLIAGSTYAEHRITHKGYAPEQVIALTDSTSRNAPKLLDFVDQGKQIELSRDEREFFAAAVTRYALPNLDVDPREVIRPSRREDQEPTLWSTTNIVQEKVLQGRVRGWTKPTEERPSPKRQKARAIRNIDRNEKTNSFIMALADQFRRMKTEPDFAFDASAFEGVSV